MTIAPQHSLQCTVSSVSTVLARIIQDACGGGSYHPPPPQSLTARTACILASVYVSDENHAVIVPA